MFFSTQEPIFLSSDSETIYFFLNLYQFSAKTVCGASQTSNIQLFTRFFTHSLDPNSLRSVHSLYQAHTSHSRLSSITIGPLYLQRPLPIFALQNSSSIFVRYSQSLYKTHTGETLVSSFPIGNLQR